MNPNRRNFGINPIITGLLLKYSSCAVTNIIIIIKLVGNKNVVDAK